MRSPCVYYHLYVLRWDPWWLQKERDRTEQNIAAKKGPRKSVTRSFIRLATEYHKFTPKIVYSIGHVFSFPFFWPKSGHVRYRRKKHFFVSGNENKKKKKWIMNSLCPVPNAADSAVYMYEGMDGLPLFILKCIQVKRRKRTTAATMRYIIVTSEHLSSQKYKSYSLLESFL